MINYSVFFALNTELKAQNKITKELHLLQKIVVYVLSILGLILIIAMGLSFTSLPFKAYHFLSAPHIPIESTPEYILILGGSGMPSADGLQRTHFGAEAAGIYSSSKVVIAHTANRNKKDRLKQLQLMARELVIKGVDTNRLEFEFEGTNTFTQASNLYDQIGNQAVLVVTSPEHMLRAILTLKKCGFTDVGGLPTFETPIDHKSLLSRTKGRIITPDNLSLRYNVWSYLIYEIKVARELTALAYYWLMGWV